jgi:hypothetical protein
VPQRAQAGACPGDRVYLPPGKRGVSTHNDEGRPAPPGSWPARVPVAPVAVLAVVVALALLGSHHFHVAWVPVVAIIVIRLLAGGRSHHRSRLGSRLSEHQLQPGAESGGVGIHPE